MIPVPHTISDVAAYIAAAGLAVLLPASIVYLVVVEMLYYRLRHKHPDHYKEIGEPSVFLNNSISKSGDMMRYLIDRGYSVVSDERTVRLGERSRQLLFIELISFIVVCLAFAVFGTFL